MTAFRFLFLCFFNIQIEKIAGILAIYDHSKHCDSLLFEAFMEKQ